MALPLPSGLTPKEVAFLAEMELVTVVPRQRLDSIPLLSGATPPLRPPHRATIPFWLALLLKKQRRANIVPPPWLHPASLAEIVHLEKADAGAFSDPPPPVARPSSTTPGLARRLNNSDDAPSDKLSPPFLPSCTADAPAGFLPYHWHEVAELLLAHAADDVAAAATGGGASAGEMRSLLRDLVEVRAAKMRAGTAQLDGVGRGGVVALRGAGAMELAEHRAFVLGVMDGLRRLGAAEEAQRREEEEERGLGGGGGAGAGEGDEEEEEEIEMGGI